MKIISKFVIVIIVASLWATPARAASAQDALRELFSALANENYAKAWSMVTEKSQNILPELIAKSASDKKDLHRELYILRNSKDVHDALSTGNLVVANTNIVKLFWDGWFSKTLSSGNDYNALANAKWVVRTDYLPVGSSLLDNIVLSPSQRDNEETFCMCLENGDWKLGIVEMHELMNAKKKEFRIDDFVAAHSPNAGKAGGKGGKKTGKLLGFDIRPSQSGSDSSKCAGRAEAESVASQNDSAFQDHQSSLLLIPAGIYMGDTSAYDSLVPYAAYENGKKAIEQYNPNGYAMLSSSARRGCNQARLYLAQVFMPADHPLNSTGISFVLENKDLSNNERLKRFEQYMQSAADNNSLTAARALVALYGEGKYTSKNPELVFKYSKVCALQKDPDGMYKLGYLYSKGQGCPKDRVAALKWMKSAAHAGSEEAKEWIEDRRGHYVNESILVSTTRKTYSEIMDDLLSWESFDDFAREHGLELAIQYARCAQLRMTPTAFKRYSYKDGTYSVVGIVEKQYKLSSPYGCILSITDGNNSIFVLVSRANGNYEGAGIKLNVTRSESALRITNGLTNLLSMSIVGGASSVSNNYRTVKKWEGPRIGGWEDLLK